MTIIKHKLLILLIFCLIKSNFSNISPKYFRTWLVTQVFHKMMPVVLLQSYAELV